MFPKLPGPALHSQLFTAGEPVALSEEGPISEEATVLLCKSVFQFPRTKPLFALKGESVATMLTILVPCPANSEEPGLLGNLSLTWSSQKMLRVCRW